MCREAVPLELNITALSFPLRSSLQSHRVLNGPGHPLVRKEAKRSGLKELLNAVVGLGACAFVYGIDGFSPFHRFNVVV